MKSKTQLRLMFLALAMFALSARFVEAEAYASEGPPDLSVCMDNGFKSLETDLGFTFENEQQCSIFAALGGTFGNSNGNAEGDFFITNLTSRDIQLRHIQFERSSGVDGVTFGVPAQWDPGVLANPLSNPNWKKGETLRVRFFYSTPVFGLAPDVQWILHLVNLPDVGFTVTYRGESGWDVKCQTGFGSCLVSGDGVHSALTTISAPLGLKLR
jgi:hypothetical protein